MLTSIDDLIIEFYHSLLYSPFISHRSTKHTVWPSSFDISFLLSSYPPLSHFNHDLHFFCYFHQLWCDVIILTIIILPYIYLYVDIISSILLHGVDIPLKLPLWVCSTWGRCLNSLLISYSNNVFWRMNMIFIIASLLHCIRYYWKTSCLC